jgi:hypothetical protein
MIPNVLSQFPAGSFEAVETRYRKKWPLLLVKYGSVILVTALIFTISSVVDRTTPKEKTQPSYNAKMSYNLYGAFYASDNAPLICQTLQKLVFINSISYDTECGPFMRSDSDKSSFILFDNITYIGCRFTVSIEYHIEPGQKENYLLAMVSGFNFNHKYDKAFVTEGEFTYSGDLKTIKTEERGVLISGTSNEQVFIACGYNYFKGYDYNFFYNLSFTSSFIAPLWACMSFSINFIAKKIRKEISYGGMFRKGRTLIIEK